MHDKGCCGRCERDDLVNDILDGTCESQVDPVVDLEGRLESFKWELVELYEDLGLDFDFDIPSEVVGQFLLDQLLVLGGAVETVRLVNVLDKVPDPFRQARAGMKL